MSELSTQAHRPRNVDWQRAAALLYGDWGTSKAYVIGLAFAAARCQSTLRGRWAWVLSSDTSLSV